MTECRSEGDLRAYFDRELPSADLERIAAHLAQCAICAERYDELAGRAQRVTDILAGLEVTPGVRQVVPMPRQVPVRWRWAAAAAALAAGLAIGAMLIPKSSSTVAVQPRKPAPVPETTAAEVIRPPALPEAAVPEVKEMVPDAAPRIRRAAARPVQRPVRREEFVRLDDEPIDTGVVVRVALGDAQVPADVILGSDGRAHAIRLVGYESGSRTR